MPIYEYSCQQCDHHFEALIRNAEDKPKCPKCGQFELAREFSVPAAAKVQGAGGSLPMASSPMPMGGCGGPACQRGLCGDMG